MNDILFEHLEADIRMLTENNPGICINGLYDKIIDKDYRYSEALSSPANTFSADLQKALIKVGYEEGDDKAFEDDIKSGKILVPDLNKLRGYINEINLKLERKNEGKICTDFIESFTFVKNVES
jgi:hypothetical protein